MNEPLTQGPFLDRRRVLGCAALFGIAGPLLVACGSDSDGDSGTPAEGTASPGSESGSPTQAAGGGIVAAADVPVGGGVVVAGAGIVVTQPTRGEFKGFGSACTHQGTTLGAVGDGRITCPNHGSQFSVEDGANVTGPNGSAGGSVADLPEIAVKVVDGQIVKA